MTIENEKKGNATSVVSRVRWSYLLPRALYFKLPTLRLSYTLADFPCSSHCCLGDTAYQLFFET